MLSVIPAIPDQRLRIEEVPAGLTITIRPQIHKRPLISILILIPWFGTICALWMLFGVGILLTPFLDPDPALWLWPETLGFVALGLGIALIGLVIFSWIVIQSIYIVLWNLWGREVLMLTTDQLQIGRSIPGRKTGITLDWKNVVAIKLDKEPVTIWGNPLWWVYRGKEYLYQRARLRMETTGKPKYFGLELSDDTATALRDFLQTKMQEYQQAVV